MKYFIISTPVHTGFHLLPILRDFCEGCYYIGAGLFSLTVGVGFVVAGICALVSISRKGIQ